MALWFRIARREAAIQSIAQRIGCPSQTLWKLSVSSPRPPISPTAVSRGYFRQFLGLVTYNDVGWGLPSPRSAGTEAGHFEFQEGMTR